MAGPLSITFGEYTPHVTAPSLVISVKPLLKIGITLAGIATAALITAWSCGLYALLKPHFAVSTHPMLAATAPIVVIATLFSLGFTMQWVLKQKTGRFIFNILFAIVWVPLFAFIFGGIYSLIAYRLSKGREPATTLLLALGLAITVFGFGYATDTEFWRSSIAFISALILLGAYRKFIGRISNNMMGFGLLHFISLFIAMMAASMSDEQRKHMEIHKMETKEITFAGAGASSPALRKDSLPKDSDTNISKEKKQIEGF